MAIPQPASSLVRFATLVGICLTAPVTAVSVPGDDNPSTPPAVKEIKPASGPAPTGTISLPETTWFGGTQWDAVDQQWEALQDSMWTFESGVASAINSDSLLKPLGLHSLMEGWMGVNRNFRDLGEFRRLHRSHFADTVCVGGETGVLGGEWSLWAGLTPEEADTACYAGGQGYGNDWNAAVGQAFDYTGGIVDLSFTYVSELEDGFDFVQLEVDTGGTGAHPWQVTGLSSGTAQLQLVPGVHLPSGPKEILLRFRLYVDGVSSDEDGLFTTTCGAFAVDDITMSGGIVYCTDFESGDDGWSRIRYPAFSQYDGDWSTLRASDELPSEPGFPPGCVLGDSVLTFYEETRWFHNCYKNNVAISPWVDLSAPGLVGTTGKVIEVGGYFDLAYADLLFLVVEAQWYPEICAVSGVPIASPFTSLGYLYHVSPPACANLRFDFSEVIPSNAERFRVAVGVRNSLQYYLCDGPTTSHSTPWIDHVRVGVFDTTAVTAVPDPHGTAGGAVLLTVSNPISLSGTAQFEFSGRPGSRARLDVIDVRGRLVRTLFEGAVDSEPVVVPWDLRSTSSHPVRPGVYFARLHAGTSVVRKIIVVP